MVMIIYRVIAHLSCIKLLHAADREGCIRKPPHSMPSTAHILYIWSKDTPFPRINKQ